MGAPEWNTNKDRKETFHDPSTNLLHLPKIPQQPDSGIYSFHQIKKTNHIGANQEPTNTNQSSKQSLSIHRGK